MNEAAEVANEVGERDKAHIQLVVRSASRAGRFSSRKFTFMSSSSSSSSFRPARAAPPARPEDEGNIENGTGGPEEVVENGEGAASLGWDGRVPADAGGGARAGNKFGPESSSSSSLRTNLDAAGPAIVATGGCGGSCTVAVGRDGAAGSAEVGGGGGSGVLYPPGFGTLDAGTGAPKRPPPTHSSKWWVCQAPGQCMGLWVWTARRRRRAPPQMEQEAEASGVKVRLHRRRRRRRRAAGVLGHRVDQLERERGAQHEHDGRVRARELHDAGCVCK